MIELQKCLPASLRVLKIERCSPPGMQKDGEEGEFGNPANFELVRLAPRHSALKHLKQLRELILPSCSIRDVDARQLALVIKVWCVFFLCVLRVRVMNVSPITCLL